MGGMLKEFIASEMEEKLKKDYPHVLHPSGIYARVVYAEKKADFTECVIKILNEDLTESKSFPEIPGIRTMVKIETGDIVAVVKMYAGSGYFVVGRLL